MVPIGVTDCSKGGAAKIFGMKTSVYQSVQSLSLKFKEEDKAKHLFWSFWLTMGALLVWSSPTVFAVVFLLGLGKECWDSKYGSGFCLYDMVCNLVGSVAGLLCGFVLSTLFA